MASREPNWKRIKARYLKGGISYRDLADQFGVSCSTLEKVAKREGWTDAKRQTSGEVAAKMPAVVAASILSDREIAKAAQLADAAWLRERMRRDEKASLADCARAIQAAQAVERKALGLEDPAPTGKGALDGPDAVNPQANSDAAPAAILVLPGKCTDWSQLAQAREAGLDP